MNSKIEINSKALNKAFKDKANWKLNFSKIARELKIPVSTVWDFYNRNR